MSKRIKNKVTQIIERLRIIAHRGAYQPLTDLRHFCGPIGNNSCIPLRLSDQFELKTGLKIPFMDGLEK